jgi:hypothetical protein
MSILKQPAPSKISTPVYQTWGQHNHETERVDMGARIFPQVTRDTTTPTGIVVIMRVGCHAYASTVLEHVIGGHA